MKNILFVSGIGNGGAERVVSILSDSLTKNGENVFIFSYVKPDCQFNFNPKVQVILNPIMTRGVLGKIKRIKMIRSIIRAKNIDTVIAFSHYNAMSSVLAAIGLNVKVIGSERNDPAQVDSKTALKLLRNYLYRKMDVLVCQTEDAKAYFPIDIQNKSVVILNPISDSLPLAYSGEREKRIVTFCRLEKQKNLPLLIDAFEEIHKHFTEYKLEIYGEGSEKEELLKIIKGKNLNNDIKILPFAKDIHDRVLNAAMFVLPSNYEGLSNSMIEAMAIGLPTIVTDCPCGGARMVINNQENGILVPVGNKNKMVKAMTRIITDQEFAKQLSHNAAKIRTELESVRIAEKWQDLF